MNDDEADRTQVVTGPAASASASAATPDDGATVIAGAPRAALAAAPGGGANADAGVLQPGTRVAEFEITSLVGQGGFGAVYQAWDHALERVVAIKEYLPASLSTRQGDGAVVPLSERHRETFDLGMRSFINEARLLAQFDHPSLLKVYRFWEERGTTYMVMPFYRGDTLRQALAATPGGVHEAWLLRIMDGVTQALAVMHAANCYHRDVAPDNIILLEGSGRPVLLDFGAARRVITDKTQAITVILKPGYAPIEQYAEVPDMAQGAWTDVYALAAVMHVAVCGRAPPPSVARLLSDSYVPLVGNEALRQRYSAQLLSAIDAGLGVRPASRPQTMAAFRAALGLDDATTQAPVRPPADRNVVAPTLTSALAPPPASGQRGWMAAAAVLLVAAGAGAWWWSAQSGAGGTDSAPSAASAPAPEAPVAQAPGPSTAPAPTSAAPRTPAESMQSLAAGAAPGWEVAAAPRKADVAIGKDKLGFEVRSNRAGFVYVYLLSSGGEMFLLFPNLLDKYNKIAPGAALALPRPSWPMDAGGPAGPNQFAVLVSQHERDFGGSGIQNEGVFAQFPLPVLAALEAARGSGPAPLLGKPLCAPNTPCQDVYGVGYFKIVEK